MSNTSHEAERFDGQAEWQTVGIVSEATAGRLKVILTPDEATGAVRAATGDFVVVERGEVGLFGQIYHVRLDSGGDQSTIIATVQLFVTVDFASGDIRPGVELLPFAGSTVLAAPAELIRAVAETRRQRAQGDSLLRFATLSQDKATVLSFTPEMVFGRHCAILGASGGGKSWTIARLLEETSSLNSKVILFDATGEFGTIVKNAAHVHIGKHPSPRPSSREVCLPYWQLTEGDLFAIFQPTGQGQAPKLRAAIKTLKLSQIVPSLALDGLIIKANRSKTHYEAEYLRNITALEDPKANFDISKLIRQIQNECVNPNRSSTELTYWGDYNGVEQSLVVPLINRIADILNSENLSPIFNPGKTPSLLETIDNFLAHPGGRILVVSMEYLSFAHHAREIVANAVGRYLLKLAREEKFAEKPVVTVIDEAHQFLREDTENAANGFAMDSFALIAKEGRKYSLTVILSTQRPRDIPESVLSQMGTFMVHRLTNDRDRSTIERACGEADQSVLDRIPALAPGQAVLLGIDFPVPLAISIEKPENPPDSHGPDYQKYWR